MSHEEPITTKREVVLKLKFDLRAQPIVTGIWLLKQLKERSLRWKGNFSMSDIILTNTYVFAMVEDWIVDVGHTRGVCARY